MEHHGGRNCGNQRIQRQQFAQVWVDKCGEMGLGVRARKSIRKGTVVGIFMGDRMSRPQRSRGKGHSYIHSIDGMQFVDATRGGTWM
mmetsp:Transcript_67583/g.140879  ORF Transcript_67583/g.140879 Transcript_67583/m.140879 type:complete len:87 (+) Transcript_67583:1057-1317(+)